VGFLTAAAALSFLLWVGVLLHPRRPYLPLDGDREAGEDLPDPAPLVSVVIPARNEAETVAASIRSHLECSWPKLEVILVDDGSTDGTAQRALEAARETAREVRIIEAGEVPEGWVGKVWAMKRGAEEAQGEYILFTDADIVFEKDLLRHLVAESRRRNLGLNSRMVLLSTEGFWEKLLVPAFVYFFSLLYSFRAVEDPRSRTAAAAGGCMLVERRELAQAGGLEAIKDAIIDDVSLARRLKAAGSLIRLASTRRARSLRRYVRLGDFWRTVTRTAYTELRYSPLRLLAATAALLLSFFVPPAALLAGTAAADPVPAALGLAALITASLLYLPTVRYVGVPAGYALGLPLTGFLYLLMTWHSAVRYALGRRSVWKEREYRRPARRSPRS